MIPILSYHAIGNEASPLWTPPELLAEQIAALVRMNYRSVTLSEAVEALLTNSEERLVAITFDDAYASVARVALPCLRALGFTATVFVVSGYCGKTNTWPGQPPDVPREDLLAWEELAKLATDGWEIGAHTENHRVLRSLSRDELEAEVRGCRQSIEANLGRPCETFAYPYGAYDEDARAMVRSTFRAAVGTSLGLASGRSDLFALPRIDAWYLTTRLSERLHSPSASLYLAARQRMREARRIGSKDWV